MSSLIPLYQKYRGTHAVRMYMKTISMIFRIETES